MVANRMLWALFGVFCFVIMLQSYIFFNISEITAMVTQGQLSVSILFTDTRPPIVTILLPADGAIFSQNAAITVQIRALDDDRVQSVIANFTLSNGTRVLVTLSDSDDDGVFEGLFDQTFFGGTYTLRAVATDVNGFRNDNESIQFTVIGPSPTPPPAIVGAVGGGSAATTVGPKRRAVVPTTEKPAPGKRIKRKKELEKVPVEQQAPALEFLTTLVPEVFTFIKAVPKLVSEVFSVVTGVMTLAIINGLIALYLISFATVRIIQKFVEARRIAASRHKQGMGHIK